MLFSAISEDVKHFQTSNNYNILLLGETGVGKSTWINGFANYAKYQSLEDAENGGYISIIPSKFTFIDDTYDQTVVLTESDIADFDKNGNIEDCEGGTKIPVTYRFPTRYGTVRIIDTPGVGDVLDVVQENINFQLVLNHIADIEELHCIIIVLKSTQSRRSIHFDYCIKQLLTYLHKDACQNIVFYFTHGRGENYRGGEAISVLYDFLVNNTIDIVLSRDTIYCVDNESVKHLAAARNKISMYKGNQKSFSESWNATISELGRVMKHVSHLKPHKVKNTQSVNDVRHMIMLSAMPLAGITKAIHSAVREIEDAIKNSKSNSSDNVHKLFDSIFQLVAEPLSSAHTICTADKCMKSTSDSSEGYILTYNCMVPSNKVDFKPYRMSPSTSQNVCTKCGCDEKLHENISYTIKRKKQMDNYPSTPQEVTSEPLQSHLENLKELEHEQQLILNVSAQCACFLKNNAIVPYNDKMLNYLALCIDHEERSSVNDTHVKKLEKIRDQYQNEFTTLDAALSQIKDGEQHVEAIDIKTLISKLFELKHGCHVLREIVRQLVKAESKASTSMEFVVELISN